MTIYSINNYSYSTPINVNKFDNSKMKINTIMVLKPKFIFVNAIMVRTVSGLQFPNAIFDLVPFTKIIIFKK